MKLKLKEEFMNCLVKRGNITLNTEQVLEENYINYFNNGFKDLFEVLIAFPERPRPKLEPKKEDPNNVED